MFDRIMVPLDGSEAAERALPVAQELARRFRSSLVLLEVVSQTRDWHYSAIEAASDRTATDQDERAVAAARWHLESVAHRIRGLPVEVDVRIGRPADAIAQAAQENGCDLICMAAQGPGSHTRNAHWSLGAIGERVVHGSTTPVLVVHPETEVALPTELAHRA